MYDYAGNDAADECPGIGCSCMGNVELHNLPMNAVDAGNDAAEMDRLWHALFLAEYNYDADPSDPHRERRDDARSQVVRHVLRIRARAAERDSNEPNE